MFVTVVMILTNGSAMLCDSVGPIVLGRGIQTRAQISLTRSGRPCLCCHRQRDQSFSTAQRKELDFLPVEKKADENLLEQMKNCISYSCFSDMTGLGN